MSEREVILNGRYQLLERVGSGGMARVYKAQDRALGRIVAVKMLHESLTGDQGFLQRFQQEAHAAANLTHPNIVTVHDIGQDRNHYYIVMEYVEGQTLKQIIRQYNQTGHPMPVSRALDLTIQICAGIGYAHRADLVHCDVKPQNVLITRDDRVKVADFGIARAISEATLGQQASQVWGTPQYFSPEQAAGNPATPASDVYSIGVILFELLTGQLPFSGDTPTALALKHMQEDPPAVADANPTVPLQLDQIVQKVLSKEPAGRYRTAGQLGRILSAYRQRSLSDTDSLNNTIPHQPTSPVSELKTKTYQRPQPTLENTVLSDPVREDTAVSQTEPLTIRIPAPEKETGNDWTAVSLGIAALIALLGLIPLWYMVYRAWAG
ncbi:MAG: serine/threonine protein kinase [Ardenticatenaceae bacterium]|nr:serine/threonine protein kinase [Ardenticatenaceae bacterium]